MKKVPGLARHQDEPADARSAASRPDVSRDGTNSGVTQHLSRRIRALRLERGLSLRAVAATAHVSPSLLSQIERGEANPSLVSLVSIAEALGVRPGALLDDVDATRPSPVVRRCERHVIEDARCRREYLMHPDDPRLEVAEIVLAPGGSSPSALVEHSGRDYGVVLDGTLTVEVGGRREVLESGDYIAYDADQPHRIVNESDRDVRLIWIVALGGADDPHTA